MSDLYLDISVNNQNSYIIFECDLVKYMELKLDYQEKDLLIECLQHRLYTDKVLVINDSLRNEIEDLLEKVEEECI